MKKALSFVICLVMVLSFGVTAFAGLPTAEEYRRPAAIEEPEFESLADKDSFFADPVALELAESAEWKPSLPEKMNGLFYACGIAPDMGRGMVEWDVADPDVVDMLIETNFSTYAMTYDKNSEKIYTVYSRNDSTFTFAAMDAIDSADLYDISDAPCHIIGLAVDYTTDTLYGIGSDSNLYAINTETGEFVAQAHLSGTAAQCLVMTVSTAGILYAIDFSGYLYTIDKTTGVATMVGDTGLDPNYAQSLVYDHDEQIMYWAFYNAEGGAIYTVDELTAQVEYVGAANGAEMLGMYTVPEQVVVPDPVPVSGVVVSPEYAQVLSGETVRLSASVLPAAEYILDRSVTWSSSDETIATVSSSGIVTTLAEGTVTITATTTDGGFTDSATIEVTGPLSVSELDYTPIELDAVYEFTLGAGDAQFVEWNYEGDIRYTKGFSIDMEFGEGGDFYLSPGPNPPADTELYVFNEDFEMVAFNQDIEPWVNYHAGLRFIPQAAGTYYFVATTYSHYYYDSGDMVLTTTSYEPVHVTGVSIDPADVVVGRGRALQLTPVFEPANTDFTTVTWEVADESIATIDADGKIRGVANGTTTVTVTTDDGGFTATAPVTVTDPQLPEYDGLVYGMKIYDADFQAPIGIVSYDVESGELPQVVNENLSYPMMYSMTYVDGMLYGYELDMNTFRPLFHIIDGAGFTVQSSIPQDEFIAIDMTYDVVSDTVYAICHSMFTGLRSLGTVDLETGLITSIAPFEVDDTHTVWTLAADNSGRLYTIADDGILYEVNPANAELTAIVDMGYDVAFQQSMVYDNYAEHMVWFQCGPSESGIVVFDPFTGDIISTTSYEADAMIQIVGGFVFVNRDDIIGGDVIPVEGVTVSPTETTIDIGETIRLTPTIAPADASNKNVSWQAADPEIVRVDDRGNILGLRAGSTTVTVTTEDGGFTATASITVTDPGISDIPEGMAKITLSADDVWDDGSGYQLLLDADATAYGTIIPTSGPLTSAGNASPEVYAEFEYKIPEDADGALNTGNIVCDESVSIFVEPGTYDWCITNPVIGDRMWIAFDGRGNDMAVEAGYHYHFEVTLADNGMSDSTELTVSYLGFYNPELNPTFTVTFVNYDDSVIETQTVKQGEAAVAPEAIHPDGLTFGAWDTDFSNVQSDLTVKAFYIGDANADSKVDSGDASMALRSSVGLVELNEFQTVLADFNGDNQVNTGDAAGILRYTVSLA